MRVFNNTETKTTIIGENIFYNNGTITAFYILPLVNYSVLNKEGIQTAITKIENALTSLASKRQNVEFSISNINKVIKAKDVYNNLLDTIRIYSEDYDIPNEFKKNIKDQNISYCILGINIDQNEYSDIEQASFKEVIKQTIDKAASKIFSGNNVNIDVKKILTIEESIYSVISTLCTRATKELVFYRFISNLYPSYEISYDTNSYLRDETYDKVAGITVQTIKSEFGYFVMNNEGVDLFRITDNENIRISC